MNTNQNPLGQVSSFVTNTAKNITNATNNTLNKVNNTVNTAINNTIKNITTTVNNGLNKINNTSPLQFVNMATNTVANTANNVVNTVANTVSSTANNVANTVANTANTLTESITEPIMESINAMNTTSVANNSSKNSFSLLNSGIEILPVILSLGVIAILLIIIATFIEPIMELVKKFINWFVGFFGIGPDASKESIPKEVEKDVKGLVDKMIPKKKQVFNVAENIYKYGDAEPLCKSFGAELATYEQVKDAWKNGADWCNYGWVKGQGAVYPTSQQTFDKLQQGPEDQQLACGEVGVNGGYFDNPELRFGVNCYGEKPDETLHDMKMLVSGQENALTPGALEYDEKVAKFRSESDQIGILPWNNNQKQWSS